MSVELELVQIFLVSDTDIEATANQRWTSEGPLANPHVIRVVIASQWRRILCRSSSRSAEKIGRVNKCTFHLGYTSLAGTNSTYLLHHVLPESFPFRI